MAKSVKTDLFAGMMNESAPETKKVEEVKEVVVEAKEEKPEKKAPAKKTSTTKKTNAKKEQPVKEEKNIDAFIQKAEKPKAASHTFYLTDATFERLDKAAKDRKISTSKLLEAMIEMTL